MELIEEQGLPPVCAALAVEEDSNKQLGRVLAEAVRVSIHARCTSAALSQCIGTSCAFGQHRKT